MISAGNALGELIDFIQSLAPQSGIKPKTWKQLIAPLQAAQSEFDSGNWNAGLIHLRMFESRVSTQIQPIDHELANSLDYLAQQIIAAVQGNATHQPSIGGLVNHGNQKSVTFSGIPGRIYPVQASSNLIQWETIGVASETDAGSYKFDDAGAATATARYYRLVVP